MTEYLQFHTRIKVSHRNLKFVLSYTLEYYTREELLVCD